MTTKVRRIGLYPLLACVCIALAASMGCSDDSSPTGGGGSGNPITVGGTATKGAIDGASVDLFQFTSTGGQGTKVAGPFTTDASGAWSGEVPAGTSGPLLVVATGGSYTDEATSQTVNVGSSLNGILLSGGVGNATPVTHAMVKNMQARIASGASLGTAAAGVVAAMTAALGYDPTAADASPVTQVSSASSTPTEAYAVLLGGVSQLLASPPTGFSGADTWDMVVGVADDLSSGVLDGMDAFGAQVQVDPGDGSPIAWPSSGSSGIDALVNAANAWATANSLGTIPSPDLTDFSDTSNGGGGGGDGQVSVSDAVTLTFVPEGLFVSGSLYTWYVGDYEITVTLSAGMAVGVFFYDALADKAWFATGNPTVSGAFVSGSTVFFEGVQCFAGDQTRVVLNGSLSY